MIMHFRKHVQNTRRCFLLVHQRAVESDLLQRWLLFFEASYAATGIVIQALNRAAASGLAASFSRIIFLPNFVFVSFEHSTHCARHRHPPGEIWRSE